MKRRTFFLISLAPLGFLLSKKKKPFTATEALENERKARRLWKNAKFNEHYGLTKAEYNDILRYCEADVKVSYELMKKFKV